MAEGDHRESRETCYQPVENHSNCFYAFLVHSGHDANIRPELNVSQQKPGRPFLREPYSQLDNAALNSLTASSKVARFSAGFATTELNAA